MLKNHCYTYFLFLTLFSFSSCYSNKQKQESGKTISVDLKKTENISILDIYSKIEIVPLETNKESFIKKVSKLVYKDNKYYVLDNERKGIFIFDGQGKFLSKILKIGKGPGEYQYIADFEINPFSNNIEILEPWGNVLIYELPGKFIRSYQLQMRGRSVHYFVNLSPSTVAFYSLVEKNSLIIYSKTENKIIKTLFEVPEVVKGTPLQTSSSPFAKQDDKVFFFQGFTNDVYELKESGLNVVFKWDFGLNNFNVKSLPENMEVPEFIKYLLSRDFVHSFLYHIEKNNYIFTKFLCGKKRYSLVYIKNDNKVIIFEQFREKISPPFSVYPFSNGISTIVDPSKIEKYVKSEVLNEENRQRLNTLKMEDNPVIVNYYLKK